MSDIPNSNDTSPEDYWSQLFVMALMACGVFVSIEYVPAVLNGAVGAIVAVIVSSVFLYCFGRVVGRMLAGSHS